MLFIKVFQSVEMNGRSIEEFIEYLDSPELVYDFYFSEGQFERIFERMKQECRFKNPFCIADKDLGEKLIIILL